MLIGITSTVPTEIIYAAGSIPCDLNNIFIADPEPNRFLGIAERAGFPATSCAWIKGIYGVLQERREITTIVVVSRGDCSNSLALAEVLEHDGRQVIPFAYPPTPNKKAMQQALSEFADRLQASPKAIERSKRQLDAIRYQLAEIDRLTWRENRVRGCENLEFLVSASDFRGNPTHFAETITSFLHVARQRPSRTTKIRLGLAGVPPILSNLFSVLEALGADSCFNEIPRQFSLPWAPATSLTEQYCRYTYPYHLQARIADLQVACRQRRLDGIIHYTQSFCFHQIEDIILKRELACPVLTLEADRPDTVDGRTLTRIETFIEMLHRKKSPK